MTISSPSPIRGFCKSLKAESGWYVLVQAFYLIFMSSPLTRIWKRTLDFAPKLTPPYTFPLQFVPQSDESRVLFQSVFDLTKQTNACLSGRHKTVSSFRSIFYDIYARFFKCCFMSDVRNVECADFVYNNHLAKRMRIFFLLLPSP